MRVWTTCNVPVLFNGQLQARRFVLKYRNAREVDLLVRLVSRSHMGDAPDMSKPRPMCIEYVALELPLRTLLHGFIQAGTLVRVGGRGQTCWKFYAGTINLRKQRSESALGDPSFSRVTLLRMDKTPMLNDHERYPSPLVLQGCHQLQMRIEPDTQLPGGLVRFEHKLGDWSMLTQMTSRAFLSALVEARALQYVDFIGGHCMVKLPAVDRTNEATGFRALSV